MFISKLSTETGFSKDTIRYYEKVGLIQSTGYVRQQNNYKCYSSETLQHLINIRKLKTAGFSLTEIKGLLYDFQQVDRPCDGLPANLGEKIATIDEKIKSLETYKRSIQNILQKCNSKCSLSQGLPSCI